MDADSPLAPAALHFRFDKDFDINAWLALYRACDYNRTWTQRNAEAILGHCAFVISAWVGDEMVGSLTVVSDAVNYALIEDVCVHPAYRRRGIASTLVRYALDRLSPLEPTTIYLHATPGLERMYEKLGFVRSRSPVMYHRPD